MYFIGAIIMLVGVTLAFVLKGAPLLMFVNPAVVLSIFLVAIGVIVATSGYKTFVRGLNAILSPGYTISDEERHNAAELYRLLGRCILLASLLCLIVGGIAVLESIYELDRERLAHAASASLVAPIYGIILAFGFFEPAVYILKKPRKNSVAVEAMEYPPDLGERLLEMCIQNGLTPEDIKNATGIELRQD